MSRPLVGMDEEPSELEKVCRRVRRAVAADTSSRDDHSGSDSGSGGYSPGCDTDDNEPFPPRAAAAQPLQFAGSVGPTRHLPLLSAASGEHVADALDDGTEGTSWSPMDPAPSGTADREPVRVIGGFPAPDTPSGAASYGGLCRVNENDSFHGMGLLSGVLNEVSGHVTGGGTHASNAPDRAGPHISNGCSLQGGCSGDGSAPAAVSRHPDSHVLSSGAAGRGGGGRVGEDLLFDLDDGGRQGGSTTHTPRMGGCSPVRGPPCAQAVSQNVTSTTLSMDCDRTQ